MTKRLAEGNAFATALANYRLENPDSRVQPFLIPAATALHSVSSLLKDTDVLVGIQNAHWEEAGAWTGEISVQMAADAGARIVEIGHSERREFFNETDETVNLKVKATLAAGLTPLLCVGESEQVRSAGDSAKFIANQLDLALQEVSEIQNVVIAYEPIWAIGENGREAQPEELAEVFDLIKKKYPEARVLYGGSVNRGNAAQLLSVPGVEGLFIGRGAWQVADYISILELAASAAN